MAASHGQRGFWMREGLVGSRCRPLPYAAWLVGAPESIDHPTL